MHRLFEECTSIAIDPDAALPWIQRVYDKSVTYDELAEVENFPMLDSKLRMTLLTKVLTDGELARSIRRVDRNCSAAGKKCILGSV